MVGRGLYSQAEGSRHSCTSAPKARVFFVMITCKLFAYSGKWWWLALWDLRVVSILPLPFSTLCFHAPEKMCRSPCVVLTEYGDGRIRQILHTSTGWKSAVLDFSLTCRSRLRYEATKVNSLEPLWFSLPCHMIDQSSRAFTSRATWGLCDSCLYVITVVAWSRRVPRGCPLIELIGWLGSHSA